MARKKKHAHTSQPTEPHLEQVTQPSGPEEESYEAYRREHGTIYLQLLPDDFPEGPTVGVAGSTPEEADTMSRGMQAGARIGRASRNNKTRYAERDLEIVRLRDVEKLTFGQIPRALKKLNAAWVDKDGELLAREAVEKAYFRATKKKPEDG